MELRCFKLVAGVLIEVVFLCAVSYSKEIGPYVVHDPHPPENPIVYHHPKPPGAAYTTSGSTLGIPNFYGSTPYSGDLGVTAFHTIIK